MVVIEVGPILVNRAGTTYGFGDEPGTPSFNLVKDVLEQYLGKDISMGYNYDQFTFIIESDVEDEGCDTSCDFEEVIESICEFMPDNHHYKGFQMQFRIVSIVEN